MSTATAAHVYSCYKNLFIASKYTSNASALQSTLLPHFEEAVLKRLCEDATHIFKQTPSIATVEPPAYVIGDINGSLYDLIRILGKSESFSTHRYVFLGNYIGSGQYSVECIALIYSLVCLCPRNVVVLRGSTEYADLSDRLGFSSDLQAKAYSPFLHQAFQESFEWLPFAAIISNSYLVAHGGINQHIMTLDDIFHIERPVSYFSMVSANTSITSSSIGEPNDMSDQSARNSSTAVMQSIVGAYDDCFYYNSDLDRDGDNHFEDQTVNKHILRPFLRYNNLKKLICGNLATPKGVGTFLGGKCIAVFSMSDYNGKQNKAGFLYLPGGECGGAEPVIRGHCLPLITINRCLTQFKTHIMERKERRTTNPHVFSSIIKSKTKSLGRSAQSSTGLDGSSAIAKKVAKPMPKFGLYIKRPTQQPQLSQQLVSPIPAASSQSQDFSPQELVTQVTPQQASSQHTLPHFQALK